MAEPVPAAAAAPILMPAAAAAWGAQPIATAPPAGL